MKKGQRRSHGLQTKYGIAITLLGLLLLAGVVTVVLIWQQGSVGPRTTPASNAIDASKPLLETYASYRHSFAIDVPFNWTIEEFANGKGIGPLQLHQFKDHRNTTSVYFSSPETRLALMQNRQNCGLLEPKELCRNQKDLRIADVVLTEFKDDALKNKVPTYKIGDLLWYREETQSYFRDTIEYSIGNTSHTGKMDGFYTFALLNPALEKEFVKYLETFRVIEMPDVIE